MTAPLPLPDDPRLAQLTDAWFRGDYAGYAFSRSPWLHDFEAILREHYPDASFEAADADRAARGLVPARTAGSALKACRHCGREGRFYPSEEPHGYCAWFDWAERKSKTHRQERCPGCGRFSVWRLRRAPLARPGVT